jgi:hypothetical protein
MVLWVILSTFDWTHQTTFAKLCFNTFPQFFFLFFSSLFFSEELIHSENPLLTTFTPTVSIPHTVHNDPQEVRHLQFSSINDIFLWVDVQFVGFLKELQIRIQEPLQGDDQVLKWWFVNDFLCQCQNTERCERRNKKKQNSSPNWKLRGKSIGKLTLQRRFRWFERRNDNRLEIIGIGRKRGKGIEIQVEELREKRKGRWIWIKI